MKRFKTICSVLVFLFASPLLFAGSVTNEGDQPVQISGKSASGIMGGGTILPGKSMPLRQQFLWIKHVPSGTMGQVRIRITEDSGATGYITTPGGTYACSGPANPQVLTPTAAPSSAFRQGYLTNSSNAAILATMVRRTGEQKNQSVMTSQTISIPEDTVEVRTELLKSSFGDVQITILVVMPDGKSHLIRSAKGLVRLREG